MIHLPALSEPARSNSTTSLNPFVARSAVLDVIDNVFAIVECVMSRFVCINA